jgi:hypothetical protein
MSDPIVNKVAGSGLVTLDLEEFIPEGEIVPFDMKDHLFMGLILKEKDFREALKQQDTEKYRGKHVAIFCSADAIIPVWAYMLAVTTLAPVAREIYLGTESEMLKHLFLKKLSSIEVGNFAGQRIVVKGCGDVAIGNYAYAEITRLLCPVAKSIMYGEPCSTVPVFKNKG